ncbi:hypothetical protein HWD99_01800 [Microbacterium sp. C5A9]|uniref:hypothetical protein n=1 Tax=Microbacterium sp. C5A9 TaxID=2736663 RepID=UPI001F51E36E|nr:hypothetical protein [Microbacterium sp. C5A9]MCI1017351.1 hypothetical protein [Microbacterium sp. C5A9]
MTDDQPNSWAAIVGPYYIAHSIARELGWPSQQVSASAVALELLELTTVERTPLYPEFQVWNGRVVKGSGEVLQALSAGTASTWTWAQWLNAPVDDETGEPAPSAIEQLRAGQVDKDLLDARHAAAAWRS